MVGVVNWGLRLVEEQGGGCCGALGQVCDSFRKPECRWGARVGGMHRSGVVKVACGRVLVD